MLPGDSVLPVPVTNKPQLPIPKPSPAQIAGPMILLFWQQTRLIIHLLNSPA